MSVHQMPRSIDEHKKQEDEIEREVRKMRMPIFGVVQRWLGRFFEQRARTRRQEAMREANRLLPSLPTLVAN